jgi:dipeptidase E
MRILLGSGGFRTEERVALLTASMRTFFGNLRQLVFIPYALQDHDRYLQMIVERGLHAGYEIDGIHRHDDPRQAIRDAEAVYVGGGNSFRLLSEMYRLDLLTPLRERVVQGLPYLGISAGSNLACPTIKTSNDMPITEPPSLKALGLVPFQINPHYFTGQVHVRHGDSYQEHFGETRDDRLREFHEMNDTPVIGLWEGGLLWIEGSRMQNLGAPARLFRKGREAEDVEPGVRLDSWLV